MSYWQDSMDVINERWPQYSTAIRKAGKPDGHEIATSSQKWPDGRTVMTLTVNGQRYYDAEHPLNYAKDIIEKSDTRGAGLVIIIGMGLGYEALVYAEQFQRVNYTDHMLVIEPDPAVVRQTLEHTPMSGLLKWPGFELMMGIPDAATFHALCGYFKDGQRYTYCRAMRILCNPMEADIRPEYKAQVLQEINHAVNYTLMEYGNDPLDSMTGVENMLDNLGEIIGNPGINLLKGAFKGKPAVIVSTGPSLDKNKHLLKGLEDRALIIAADASLKPLLQIGVRPHMVATLEREMDVVKLFDGLTADQLTDSYLAACPVVFPEVYQAYPGQHVVVYRNFDHFKWLEIDKGILNIKFSAGNMAFSLAQYMACEPIILIGQDLAIAGNKTNADGAVLGTEQDSYLREPRMMVPANMGGEIETTRSLKLFLEAYNNDMATHPGLVINATEGGARINRTLIMPFAEAIDKHLTADIHPLSIIRERLSTFAPGNDGEKITAKIDYTYGKFGEMIQQAQEGVKEIRRQALTLKMLKKDYAEEKMKAVYDAVFWWKVDIHQDFPTWQLFFAHIGQAWFLNFELKLRTYRRKFGTLAPIMTVWAHWVWFHTMTRFFRACQVVLQNAKERMK